jgi:hypothetical protein
MDQNMLFMVGLGLSAPWKVVRSGLEDSTGGTKFLYIDTQLSHKKRKSELARAVIAATRLV